MKYNLFLESDDEDEKDLDTEKDDEKDEDEKKDSKESDDDGTDNDYLDSEESDFDDEESEDTDSDMDNDYLGDSSDESEPGMGDEDTGCSDLFNKISKCAYAATVVSNNLFHIHLHVSGKKFDRIHRLSEEMYRTIQFWVDRFSEWALEDKNNKLDNQSNAAQYVAEITLETEDDYNYESSCTAITTNLKHMLECIKCARSCSDSRTDIQSKIDEYIGYLNKEINYFMERRMSTNESFMFEVK